MLREHRSSDRPDRQVGHDTTGTADSRNRSTVRSKDNSAVGRRGEFAQRRLRHDRRRDARSRFDEQADELRRIAIGSAYRILRDPGLSEEIAQEALYRTFEKWQLVESYARPWTSRIATNLAIDSQRRTREHVGERIEAAEADGADRVIERDELRRAFGVLTPRLRKTVELRIVRQLDPDEAAEHLGCSRAAVLKNTTRGLRLIREELARSSIPAPRECARTACSRP